MSDTVTDSLHVAMVVQTYPIRSAEPRGGVEAVCVRLVRALCGIAGIRVTVICPTASDDVMIHDGSLDVITMRKRNPLPVFADLLGPACRRVAAALRHVKPDITHYQAFAWWPAHIPGPSVLTVHGVSEIDTRYRGSTCTAPIRSWLVRQTEGRARSHVFNVIAISGYTASVLRTDPNRNVWRVPNPVPDEFFNLPRLPRRGRMLVAGVITPLKNTLGVIRAAARVASVARPIEL